MVVHSAATVSNTVSIPPVPRANTQCTEKCLVPAADSPPPASKSLDSPLDGYHSVYDFQMPPPPPPVLDPGPASPGTGANSSGRNLRSRQSQDNPTPRPKKRRRPSKQSKPESKSQQPEETQEVTAPAKKRGRPAGSKNKN
jgi:hypothetical protein